MTYSNAATLIPAEVEAKSYKRPGTPGFTVDREGLNNAYAVMPKMTYAEFPSKEQQLQYLKQGAFVLATVGSFITAALIVSNLG